MICNLDCVFLLTVMLLSVLSALSGKVSQRSSLTLIAHHYRWTPSICMIRGKCERVANRDGFSILT